MARIAASFSYVRAVQELNARFLRGERDLTLTTAGRLFAALGLKVVSGPKPRKRRGRPPADK